MKAILARVHPNPQTSRIHSDVTRRWRISLILVGLAAISVGPVRADLVLGVAQSFAVLGATTVTNTGSSTIAGNVGVSPGTAITGFPPGVVTGGTVLLNDALAIQARADATTAYGVLASLSPSDDLTGQDLGGLVLTPGVYRFSSSAQLTGQLTLDGQGLDDPFFAFQIGSTFTTASASVITLINGAKACDVYFQVGSSTTLGTGSDIVGTIISYASNTLTTGASLNGRVIALTGAVTLDSNDIMNAYCEIIPPDLTPVPELASTGMFGSAAIMLIGLRRFAQNKRRKRAV
jgi:hypothetical protein